MPRIQTGVVLRTPDHYGGLLDEIRSRSPERIQPSQPGSYGPEQGAYVRLPGSSFPPAGAIPVDIPGDANIAPGALAQLITFAVPDSVRFRMVGIGFGADDEVALRFLTWSIRFNGDTVPGYVGMPAAVGSIRQLAEIFLLAGSSVTVTVQVNINAFAVLTYRYICRVRGHLYAEKEAG